MGNEMLKVFENKEFGKVRTLVIDDGPWFVGKDVTTILGYGNKIGTKAYVTGKGQMYIIEKLRKDFT